jgi:hypothetical protein
MEIVKCHYWTGLGPRGTQPNWLGLGLAHSRLSARNRKQWTPHSPSPHGGSPAIHWYPVFMPKPGTHRMYDPGSIVPYIQIKTRYSNMLLRRKRWFGNLWWGVLCCALPCGYSCGVMESSVVLFRLRVVTVFRGNIYVIIILYSWHLVIYKQKCT